jgi:hypothetical protein
MEHLSTIFLNATHEDFNIYAFGEGLPFNKNWVKFSFRHIESYLIWFISGTFFIRQNLCGIKDSILLTLEEKPHFSTCLRRLKVSFVIIFHQK